MVPCLLGVGIAGSVEQSKATQNALLACACIWVAGYASGIAPVASAYQGESSTPRLRAKTNSFSQAFAALFRSVKFACGAFG